MVKFDLKSVITEESNVVRLSPYTVEALKVYSPWHRSQLVLWTSKNLPNNSLQWTLPDPLLGCNIPGYFLT